jgi:predicted TIM-barrel fold metal-dependent hydrolase
MSLSVKQRIISADDHMDIHVLPPDLYQARLPQALRERGPRVVDTDDGAWWLIDGQQVSPSGRKAAGFLQSDQHGFRPGTPKDRIEDMDRDGVWAQVIYSPTTTQMRFADPELAAPCMRAYNDWAHEFNQVEPDRLLLLADIPSHDPKAAADELARVAKLGHRGAIIHQHIGDADPVFEDSWHRFWDVAEETRLPISVHLGPGLTSLKPKLGSWRFPAMVAIIPMQLDEVLAGMVMSGILETRPHVKLVLGEGGLGWVPYVIERLDHEHHKYYEKTTDHRLSMLPSEIFARQVYMTYEDEQLGVELIPRIGIGNVMWASDYPHGDSTWPESRKAIDGSPLASLGEEAVRRIVCENCAEIYGIAAG